MFRIENREGVVVCDRCLRVMEEGLSAREYEAMHRLSEDDGDMCNACLYRCSAELDLDMLDVIGTNSQTVKED